MISSGGECCCHATLPRTWLLFEVYTAPCPRKAVFETLLSYVRSFVRLMTRHPSTVLHLFAVVLLLSSIYYITIFAPSHSLVYR